MGCTGSKAAGLTTNEIDAQLQREAESAKNVFKVLTLGPGESGKSTLMKQLEFIYLGTESMSKAKLETIYPQALNRNAMESMAKLLSVMEERGLHCADPSLEPLRAVVMGYTESQQLPEEEAKHLGLLPGRNTPRMTREQGKAVAALWKDETVREVYKDRSTFWMLDGAEYYFENCERFLEFSKTNFPTEEDILQARVRTTGAYSADFKEGPYTFSVWDVGGQRSERKKWMGMLDDCKAVIFVISLKGYAQVLYEDSDVLRMQEALTLFKTLNDNPQFDTIPFFVYFNKKDLFLEEIKQTSLKKCFPEYDGPDGEAEPALEYIQKIFLDTLKNSRRSEKQFRPCTMCIQERSQVQVYFQQTRDLIMQHYAMGTPKIE
ncbi:unnamed protein product [Chrysoparadoxa australica]